MNYRSNATLLGLPLVHITTGTLEGERYRRGVARGWIAIGDIAFGVLFSAGGVAAGGVAVGGFALGALTIGGLALGVFAIGGAALGVVAAGGAAFGWHAAIGGLALARDFAVGGVAIAEHANDAAASQRAGESLLLSIGDFVMRNSRWFVLLALLPGLSVFYRRLRGRAPGEPLRRP